MAKEIKTTFDLIFAVRDARLAKGTECLLLLTLATRAKANAKKQFSCFPSYRQLAEDTQADPDTLKRAAKRLEERGIIQRKVRANHSNLWYLNVELIQKAAERNREADAAAKASNGDELVQFSVPETEPVQVEDIAA